MLLSYLLHPVSVAANAFVTLDLLKIFVPAISTIRFHLVRH